jgi:hypothetical protein
MEDILVERIPPCLDGFKGHFCIEGFIIFCSDDFVLREEAQCQWSLI